MTTHIPTRIFWIIGCLAALLMLPAVLYAVQSTPQFQCLFYSGYATEINPGHYALDLQCQPVIGETITIPVGQSRTITVNLAAFYTATGRTTADFSIHLAMDRARILLREADSLQGTLVTDTAASLADVPISTSASSYTFVIQNEGIRSAVFDLSLRVRP